MACSGGFDIKQHTFGKKDRHWRRLYKLHLRASQNRIWHILSGCEWTCGPSTSCDIVAIFAMRTVVVLWFLSIVFGAVPSLMSDISKISTASSLSVLSSSFSSWIYSHVSAYKGPWLSLIRKTSMDPFKKYWPSAKWNVSWGISRTTGKSYQAASRPETTC